MIKRWFKWRYLRWQVKVESKAYKKRKLTEDEKFIKRILIKIVSNPKNDILLSPLSKTVYIQTERKDYTIVLYNENIKISNHELFIETPTSFFFHKSLVKIVHHYLEKRRLKVDEEIFKDELNGLSYMLNKLKYKN